MKKTYKNGKYIQTINIEKGMVTDMTCDCMWGSLHPGNFQKGEKLCRHIENLIKEQNAKANER